MYFVSVWFLSSLSTFVFQMYRASFTKRIRIEIIRNKFKVPMFLVREWNSYPIRYNYDECVSSFPLIRDLTSIKSNVKILNRCVIWSLTTSANFTSIVKTCSIMSGVRVKEINGKTLEFSHRALK